ncbi:helix-turn-helix transcriptional regulator [Staphylococcus durrellii]|uniref:helix-turn-helix transcriptional regulator n=1 Tax=Staphylococcus durrellii TaxID=2781773 RepID=UPI0018A08860|nr:helix-turn-helix transcriptional regulator [Staphylococcus durrellii]MBF7015983.1 helix-turn-helix transcriptional regulator [Staphylococcus durrellii]
MRNRLKELRARDGYNQTQLARKAGISRQTISLIERNDFMPSILTAVKIARIFNENVESIFIFEEEEL